MILEYSSSCRLLDRFFTWMKYLPSSIAKWKRDAEAWFKRDSVMFEGMFKEVKKRVVSTMRGLPS